MKENTRYKPFDKFVLRTPLKPFSYLQELFSDSDSNIESIKKELQNPIIKESIFLASPDFFEQLNAWLNGKELVKKDLDRLLYSVTKYLSRLSSRSTPFGLFAGVSIGRFSGNNQINIPDLSEYKRKLRLDMNYTVALAIHLSNITEIKKQIRFYPNTSKYISGNQIRYVEYSYRNAKRVHHIAAVDNTEYLQKVLNKAESGKHIEDLVKILVDDEVTYEEAEYFINELIDNQILISELEPSVSGDDLLVQTINILENLEKIDEIVTKLKHIKSDIDNINSLPLGIDISKYFELIEKIKALGVDFQLKFLFQVDMAKPVKEIQISNNIPNNILKALNILNRISPKPSETNLTKFKDSFYERYEDAEVPLLHALDTETGIGYLDNKSGAGIPSPLVDELNLPSRVGDSYKMNWDSYNSFILKKYLQAIKNGDSEIEIIDSEIEKITQEPDWTDLPKTMSAMVQLFKRDDEDLVYIKNCGGSSAANLLGRFAYTDETINDFVQEIADYEQSIESEKILAEIVHLPESRTGNVLLRPIIRKYEIPYLAKSNIDERLQINPDDLVISIKRNRLVLRSKKLNKEIIPHLSNAHNFSYNALPVYQFLCDLQTYNLRGGIGFTWGSLQNEFEYLPRVRYGNVIFSLAEWRIKQEDFEKIVKLENDESLRAKFRTWRNNLSIPSWVSLVDGDNKLTLNLDNVLCIKTLISLVKKRSGFTLTEYYLNKENAFIKDNNDIYANEFIFAFKISQQQ